MNIIKGQVAEYSDERLITNLRARTVTVSENARDLALIAVRVSKWTTVNWPEVERMRTEVVRLARSDYDGGLARFEQFKNFVAMLETNGVELGNEKRTKVDAQGNNQETGTEIPAQGQARSAESEGMSGGRSELRRDCAGCGGTARTPEPDREREGKSGGENAQEVSECDGHWRW